jgi:hypothetical protein
MTLRVIDGGKDAKLSVAEYVWVAPDGNTLSQVKAVPAYEGEDGLVPEVRAPWVVDDIVLSPCFYTVDPFQPQPAFLVLCETRHPNGDSTAWNSRAKLREAVHHEGGRRLADWVFHQKVWKEAAGWKPTQDFFLRCIDAGLMIRSACFDPKRLWWFQIGRRGGGLDRPLGQNYTLEMCDHLVLARHLLKKAALERGLEDHINLAASNHVLFSTVEMREDPKVAKAVADHLGATLDTNGFVRIEVSEAHYSPYSPYGVASATLTSLLEKK